LNKNEYFMYLTGIADFRREEIRPIYSGKEEKL
jgi:hypothetical protein